MAELVGKNSEAAMYIGEPLRTFKGRYAYPSNDPDFRGGEFLGREFLTKV